MNHRLFLLGLMLLPTAVASAHPGHGVDGGSHEVSHYLSEPLHVGLVIVAATSAIVATVAWRRWNQQSQDAC
jgi:hypothetical protein